MIQEEINQMKKESERPKEIAKRQKKKKKNQTSTPWKTQIYTEKEYCILI